MTKVATNTSPVDIEARKAWDIKAGDTVKVYQKIQEKGKTRLQMFEGMVLARKHGTEAGATITVRRVAGGYGVEKIFPLYSPLIDKVEVTKRAKVRRAKLYYVRRKAAKEISKRMKMEMMRTDKVAAVAEETAVNEVPPSESN
jgi:large subunit ribosomal protein L19